MDIARSDPLVGSDERGQDKVGGLEVALFIIPTQLIVAKTYFTDLHFSDHPALLPHSTRFLHRVLRRVEFCHFSINPADASRNVIETSQLALVVEIDDHLATRTVDRHATDDRLEGDGHVDNPVILDDTVGARRGDVQAADPENPRIFWKELVSP